jgi:hypothetical protein
MCKSKPRSGFDYIRWAYRQASTHLRFWHYGWMFPFFNAPIGIPVLIGSVAVFVIHALGKGLRSSLSTGD